MQQKGIQKEIACFMPSLNYPYNLNLGGSKPLNKKGRG